MAIFDVPLGDLRRRGTIKWRRWEPDVLPLFVAEMDAHLAPPIREVLERALAEGDTGYPELPAYQEAFAAYAEWQWGWHVGVADQKLATDVVTGMREAVLGLSEPDDHIVINSPIYPPFRSVVTTTGRRVLDVPLVNDRLDLAGLETAFAEHRPPVYLLCSPHNPNGTIHTAEELSALARLADRYGVVVVSDEIHAPLAGAAHTPYLAVPGAANALIITSASKSWNLAAIKAGLVIGERPLLERLNPMMSDGASYFGVLAHAAALTDGREWVAQAAREIADNKRFFAEELAREVPELSYTPSDGTYLAWLDCSPLGLEDPGRHFHQVGRVRFNLGREFAPSSSHFVRVNLATSREIIADAVGRMSSSLAEVRAAAEAGRRVDEREAEPTRTILERTPTLASQEESRVTAPIAAVVDAGPVTAPMEPLPFVGLHTNSGEFVNVVRAVVVGREPRPVAGYERAEVLRVPSPHLDISRNHLAVEVQRGEVLVRDLHSVNGTVVLPPEGSPFTLRDGASAPVVEGTILDIGEGVSLRIEPPRHDD